MVSTLCCFLKFPPYWTYTSPFISAIHSIHIILLTSRTAVHWKHGRLIPYRLRLTLALFQEQASSAPENNEDDVCIFGAVGSRVSLCIGSYVDTGSRSSSSQRQDDLSHGTLTPGKRSLKRLEATIKRKVYLCRT